MRRERPLLPYPCPPRPSPLPAAGGGCGRVSQRRAGGAPGRGGPAWPYKTPPGPPPAPAAARAIARAALPRPGEPSLGAPALPARSGGRRHGPVGPGRGCGRASGRGSRFPGGAGRALRGRGAGRWPGAAAALQRPARFSSLGVPRPLLSRARLRVGAAAARGEAAPGELRAPRTGTGCGGGARGRERVPNLVELPQMLFSSPR